MTQALIELSELGFSWPGHPQLLDIPAFRLDAGETLFLKGPSGSGKTTLLGLLGGVQRPSRGSVRLLGQELTQLSAGARDRFRVDHTGYIFQQFNLLYARTSSCRAAFPDYARSGQRNATAASTERLKACSLTWA
jgi:putative ABC transport system ATP-binding protein